MASLEVARSEMTRRANLVETVIRKQKPALLELFFTYQNEALTAREFREDGLVVF